MRKIQNNAIDPIIEQAIVDLQQGKIVAFPTETVYGLGANARDEQAIARVFAAKQRPLSNPLIVHLATSKHLPQWTINIPDNAWLLAKYFWPGPLTMILEKHPSVLDLITANQNTIALRVPRHPLTLELLRRFDSGLIGPSANSYGRISPTLAQHVKEDLGAKVDRVLDGGPCLIGIESTIVHVTHQQVSILRPGSITSAQIANVLGIDANKLIKNPITNKIKNLKVPGSHKSHYAPKNSMHLASSKILIDLVHQYLQQNKPCAVLSFQAKPDFLPQNYPWLQVKAEPLQYAQNLYNYLRELDNNTNIKIFVEMPPIAHHSWIAINDRLQRASQNAIFQLEESYSLEASSTK